MLSLDWWHLMELPSATRPAVHAGRFYPASASSLRRMVEQLAAEGQSGSQRSPKAVIAPHAGYSYSGPIAGSAFASWRSVAAVVRRVVVLGPSHWVDFPGLALPAATALSTPLGEVRLDQDAVVALSGLPQVRVFDAAYEREHSLEVELPFLQVMLSAGFVVTPLVVGRATDAEIQEVVERLWGGEETRFVLSSDLSHYLEYSAACRTDRETAEIITTLDLASLTALRACGYRPVRGFLGAAANRGLRGEVVDLRNSGDTAGSRDEVVGYGAFHFGAGD